MRKLRNRKALSPVIAAIILIAVTVAVSIAVAAWMGALTISFMGGTEQLDIQHITWADGNFTIVVKNTGTSTVTIDHIKVNNDEIASNSVYPSTPDTIDAGGNETYVVTYTWTPGDPYDIAVVTSKGTAFPERFTGGVNA